MTQDAPVTEAAAAPAAAPPPKLWLLALAVGLLAAAVFIPAMPGPWLYDDHSLIVRNPYIQSLEWWPRWFVTDFWAVNEETVRFGNRMIYWRPVVTASYALDWRLGGGSPVFYHLMNTLWHGGVGVLSFLVLRRWIGATWPAFVAALIFAVHPTKAESVAWISGRTDVLCMLAVLVATIGISRRLRGARGGIALEVLGTALAYTTKEQAIVLPAFAAVEAWVAAGRPAVDRFLVVRILKVAWIQVLIAVGYLAVRGQVMPIRAAASEGGGSQIPILSHVQIVCETLGRFIALTVAPIELSIQQALVQLTPENQLVHSTPHVLLGALAIVAAIAVGWLARRRLPAVTMGIAFYFITLAPTSNFVYTEMATLISERFLYLPSLGIALVIGAVLAWSHGTTRRVAYAIGGLAIVLFGAQAINRSADYADDRGFWQRELEINPHSYEARNFFVNTEFFDRRFRSTLVHLLELSKHQRRYTYMETFAPGLALQLASTYSMLVPDGDTARLLKLDEFARLLIERPADQPVATLELPELTFTFPIHAGAYQRQLTLFRARLFAFRSELHSRMGNDAKAIEFVSEAKRHCTQCVSVAPTATLVYARAGKYDEAYRELDAVAKIVYAKPVADTREHVDKAHAFYLAAFDASGPQQLQLRASELATLEAWGRAYQVLAPHKHDIKQAPRFALGFAELAYRAGDTAIAREVLAAHVPPAAIEPKLAEWTRAMGWMAAD
ncbi:MAG: hypothetical protein H0X17_10665 [Deltaproteobacteria bacterium]|nr:hypothetical protein [Deltaproteobacteria bacterium]